VIELRMFVPESCVKWFRALAHSCPCSTRKMFIVWEGDNVPMVGSLLLRFIAVAATDSVVPDAQSTGFERIRRERLP
jgi:hypothetical protein